MKCPNCGVENPEGAKFCQTCAWALGPAYAQPFIVQGSGPVISSQTRKKTPTWVLVLVIAVAAIVIGVVVVASLVMMTTDKYPIFEGAYAEWNISAIAYFIPVSGTMRIDVVDLTSTDYTVVTSYTGDIPMDSETDTYPIEDTISVVWTLGTYQGMEYVHTVYGLKELEHFIEYNGSTTTDYYVGQDNNWPYKIVMSDSGLMATFELSSTNIDWVKDG